jgi:PIN domain nuclease of toxin-antitoxin system
VRLLLDTSTLIHLAEGGARLSSRAAKLMADPEAELFVSAASAFEVAIKQAIQKLSPDFDPIAVAAHFKLAWLPLHEGIYKALRDLPLHHRDAFDRLLIAQAIVEGCTLISSDRNIARYAVSWMW